MKRGATVSNGRSEEHGGSFRSVLDTRKRKIPGLWRRGARYYAQLRVDLGNGQTAPRRLALVASSLDEARAELERKRTERRDGKLPQTGQRPKFEAFVREYLDGPALAHKKPATQTKERLALAGWCSHLGGVRLDKLVAPLIHAYREKRLAAGVCPRTVNLDVVALRNVLKLAVERGLLDGLPKVRQLKEKPPLKRPLLTNEEVSRLLDATTRVATKNGRLLRFYLRFLAFAGSREKETLALRWADVDFPRELVTIGSNRSAKNMRTRAVDFSPELGTLLREMAAVRPPDTSWLFPSPQRGPRDVPAKTLRESLNLARTATGLPWVSFHDLRHFFASQCVMTGIDFMTIAAWLGHRDGGILVGRVYGHLADSHKKDAAHKLIFLAK